jgi:hypothetical protein
MNTTTAAARSPPPAELPLVLPGSRQHRQLGGFCDPHLDNLASQAQAAQLTDPAAARSRWAQMDRIATDQAPYVPVYNDAGAIFVSSRVANYQASPLYGPCLTRCGSGSRQSQRVPGDPDRVPAAGPAAPTARACRQAVPSVQLRYEVEMR